MLGHIKKALRRRRNVRRDAAALVLAHGPDAIRVKLRESLEASATEDESLYWSDVAARVTRLHRILDEMDTETRRETVAKLRTKIANGVS